jgi:tetratricopeptide (TPR) repeat protein
MKDKIISLWVVLMLLWTPSVALAEAPTVLEEAPAPAAEAAPAEAAPSEPPPSPVASFEEVVKSGQINAFKIDHGIERSDLAASYLLLKAEEAMRRGSLNEAEQFGEAAVAFSPASPAPRFFLFDLAWAKNKTDFPTLVNHSLTALQLAIDDFWFSHSIVGTFLVLSFLAILFSLLTFLLYSLVSYSPLWIHKIYERSRGFFHPVAAGLFFAGILFIPFVFGLSIFGFILLTFLLFWGFYSRSEKGIAVVFLVAVGLSAWSLPFLLTFFTAKSPMLNHMVRNHQEDFFWSPPAINPDESDWRGKVIHASYQMQKGDYRQAESLYQKALDEFPGSAMIFNNLGNIAFYLKEYPRSIDLYRQALNAEPGLVSAHYNMSLAYREMLSFDEGSREYDIAKGVNAGKVETYTRKSVLFPDFPLIDERFAKMNLWRQAVTPNADHLSYAEKIWQGIVGKIPLHRSAILALLALLGLTVSSRLFERFYNASFCIICRKAICKRCQRTILSYHLCGQCGMQFKSIKKSDLAFLEAEEKKFSRRLLPFFLIPGGGHFAMKRAVVGLIFSSLFYFFISYLFFGEVLFSATHWHLQSGRWIWGPASIVLLYIVSVLDLMRTWSNESWL